MNGYVATKIEKMLLEENGCDGSRRAGFAEWKDRSATLPDTKRIVV